jgi:ribonuclease J
LSELDITIFGLGGLGEIGKNMYGIQYKNEMIVVDAGIKFPEEDMPGIDYVIPDITYLIEHIHKVKGIFLTHGHEDHIGALPFVLKQLKVPVYGASLTLGLVRSKLEEHRLLNEVDLHLIQDDTVIDFDEISVSFFRTIHSIPDSFGIVVTTPNGVIVQTGDFKFDFTPVGKHADLSRMAEIGNRGVLALLSDSTNSEKEGFTPSEKTIGDSIIELFSRCTGRILFATFASNVHRLQQVIEAAKLFDRKIAVIGRSMDKVFQIGQDLGYIRIPDGMMIDVRECHKFSAEKIVIICTGSQGEPNAALTRIANGSHRLVEIHPGDVVIFSASPIPGNTLNVNRSIDLLSRAGAEVIYGSILDIHASGHGCQEDLKLMLNLMKPKYFIPIHGEYRMLVQHGKLAEEVGIPSKHIFLLNIGNVLHVSDTNAKLGANVASGSVLIDGKSVSNVGCSEIEHRKKLSRSGLIIIVATIDKQSYRILSGPDIVSRGFVYVRESGGLIKKAEKHTLHVMMKLAEKKVNSIEEWKTRISEQLSVFFEQQIDRAPMIVPIIMEVEILQASMG